MEIKQKVVATVKSPSKDAHLREGIGFSLNEILQAGKTVKVMENRGIKVDYFRKSVYPENVAKLKAIEIPKKKVKKRDPFVKKEKKKKPYKPTKPKAKTKVKAPVKPKPVKKEKPIKKEIGIKEEKGMPLTELSGLGAATAKKFIELGVTNVEELVKENPEELATLIKGVSLERLAKWIEEGKSFIK